MKSAIGWLVFGTVGGALLFAGLSTHRLPQWFVEQDKLEHVCGFLCFAFSLRLAAKRIRWPAALALSCALAMAIEGVQFWIPGRTPSLADALAGVLGAALGWRCGALARAAVTPVEPPGL